MKGRRKILFIGPSSDVTFVTRDLEVLLSEHRVGTQTAFDEAIERAVDALSPLVIVAE